MRRSGPSSWPATASCSPARCAKSWNSPNSPTSRSRLRCWVDRKSTRLNSSHSQISYAVFCLKKKKHSGQSEPVEQLPREEPLMQEVVDRQDRPDASEPRLFGAGRPKERRDQGPMPVVRVADVGPEVRGRD